VRSKLLKLPNIYWLSGARTSRHNSDKASSHKCISVLNMKNITNIYCTAVDPHDKEMIPGEGYWQKLTVPLMLKYIKILHNLLTAL
jgi:hypothetical protein